MADHEGNAEVQRLSWYHENISRHVAEGLLMANGKDGSYLLRASASNPGEYSLSVRCASSVKHFQIGWDGSQFKFGMGSFSNISEFVEHFENKPLIGGDSGVLTLLKYPYPRDIEEPTTYEKVRVHAEWGKNRKSSIENSMDDGVHSFGSKEGYLTKLGGKVKNWKTRWFVLLKNELKYFKTKGDREPIKTIDLEDCQEVARDDSLGKGNCFRIVMPYRTFFCYANSTQEAEEWIKILQWKLENVTTTKQRRSTYR
ncbi:dual adapter for phosphotyrosine and 3-phosphotyrosine and 3-phosphoinositide-like isoform X2 [Stylophora pistillata]|uniref:Dual adapter for phosphotyrosine and 3-phosphotyrosine and 3-phosphoinositide n=1 Tax=Stylophora pistillata TaxID=50429 RepID=A0A2B4RE70_STYPI|nr:dual adapter for phosphotyrosine and 3-phosphotyrosine and 3-phosphoinositide-like isoform X2 [Stylophora pistillata]PFX14637.1 Dual adapter for phosphotyrosine and 3-phosphotyrosine and 3-phosphoinositide [Stylophora pistillata]